MTPGSRVSALCVKTYGRVIEDISSTDSQAAPGLALSIDEPAGAGLSRTEQRGGL